MILVYKETKNLFRPTKILFLHELIQFFIVADANALGV